MISINEVDDIIKTVDTNNNYNLVSYTEITEEMWLNIHNEMESKEDNFPVDCLTRGINSFKEWNKRLLDAEMGKYSKSFPPNYAKLLVRTSDSKVCGGANIRPKINDLLRQYGGNIGYFIAPSERNKKLAILQLGLAIKLLYNINIREILVSCNTLNRASETTIRKFTDKIVNEGYDTNCFHPETLSRTYKIEIQ